MLLSMMLVNLRMLIGFIGNSCGLIEYWIVSFLIPTKETRQLRGPMQAPADPRMMMDHIASSSPRFNF